MSSTKGFTHKQGFGFVVFKEGVVSTKVSFYLVQNELKHKGLSYQTVVGSNKGVGAYFSKASFFLR